MLIECVINISEGRDVRALADLAGGAQVAPLLRDLHRDPDHHRSVFTVVGRGDEVVIAAKALASATVERFDLTAHQGAHPRLGLVDVVPFIPYLPGRPPQTDLSGVIPLRDEFAQWLGTSLGVPSFLYGPLPGGRTRTLPDIRRHAFGDLAPDFGPSDPHPTAGASAIGARPVLVAYNVWVTSPELARRVASLVRTPMVRALGLEVGDRAQVSCNLIDPAVCGPGQIYDEVTFHAAALGGAVEGTELVGLVPESVLRAIPEDRWPELGLSTEVTVESRLVG